MVNLKAGSKVKMRTGELLPWHIGNTDNVSAAYKAHIQNEICLSLAQRVIYAYEYYFAARLDLARVSFAVFNGYCRLCGAVYERLTQIRGKIWWYLSSLGAETLLDGRRCNAARWRLVPETDAAPGIAILRCMAYRILINFVVVISSN